MLWDLWIIMANVQYNKLEMFLCCLLTSIIHFFFHRRRHGISRTVPVMAPGIKMLIMSVLSFFSFYSMYFLVVVMVLLTFRMGFIISKFRGMLYNSLRSCSTYLNFLSILTFTNDFKLSTIILDTRWSISLSNICHLK